MLVSYWFALAESLSTDLTTVLVSYWFALAESLSTDLTTVLVSYWRVRCDNSIRAESIFWFGMVGCAATSFLTLGILLSRVDERRER